VARIELGASRLHLRGALDARYTTVIAVFQAPGANVLAVPRCGDCEMDELAKQFHRQ